MARHIPMLLILKDVLKFILSVILVWQINIFELQEKRKRVYWWKEQKNFFFWPCLTFIKMMDWNDPQCWQNAFAELLLRWPDTTVIGVIVTQKQSQLKLGHLPNIDGKERQVVTFVLSYMDEFWQNGWIRVKLQFLSFVSQFPKKHYYIWHFKDYLWTVSQSLWL